MRNFIKMILRIDLASKKIIVQIALVAIISMCVFVAGNKLSKIEAGGLIGPPFLMLKI